MTHRHVGQATIIVNNPDLVRTMHPAGRGEVGVVIVGEVEVEVIAEVEVLAGVREEAEAVEEDDSDYFYKDFLQSTFKNVDQLKIGFDPW